jgi:hypothetical protein
MQSSIFDEIRPNSFYQEFEEDYEPEEDVNFTEEDMEEVEIFNWPLCNDHYNTNLILICEYHQKELESKINN